jgi:hypothetical protein
MKLILIIQDLEVNFEYYPINSKKIMYETVTCAEVIKNIIFKSCCKKFITTYYTYITFHIQPGLFLCNCFLHDYALMLLENLNHFLNLCNNFWFNTIWHMRSVTNLIFCRRLVEKCVTVMLLVMCMDWLHWWYKDVAHVVFCSTQLAFLISTSEKRKSTLPSAIKAKNLWKTIGITEKSDVINQP